MGTTYRTDYSMYTDEGNEAVREIVDAVLEKHAEERLDWRSPLWTEEVVYAEINERLSAELSRTHPEFIDTVVRECIWDAIASAGYPVTQY